MFGVINVLFLVLIGMQISPCLALRVSRPEDILTVAIICSAAATVAQCLLLWRIWEWARNSTLELAAGWDALSTGDEPYPTWGLLEVSIIGGMLAAALAALIGFGVARQQWLELAYERNYPSKG